MKKRGEAVKPGNEIVLCQLDETVRLEVRLAKETVWLNQARVDRTVVNRHIHNALIPGLAESVCWISHI